MVLSRAITACTEALEKHKGKLLVKEAPRAVSVALTLNFNVDFAISFRPVLYFLSTLACGCFVSK